jgi:eight-cysteine-cluster-containing protein
MNRYLLLLMLAAILPLCMQSGGHDAGNVEKLNYTVKGCGAEKVAEYGVEGYELVDGQLKVHIMRNCCSDEILVEKSENEYRIIEKDSDGEICKCNCISTVEIYNVKEEDFKVTFTNHNGESREIKSLEGEFCGWSTYAECKSDADCKAAGCSGQVCAGVGEEIITTCEWRECFDAAKYGMRCGCINNQCQWAQS